MAYVKHDRTKTLEQALNGDADTIYYTTDTHVIVINGQIYSAQSEEIITSIENKIDESVVNLSNQINSIDLSPVAKEQTLNDGINTIINKMSETITALDEIYSTQLSSIIGE